MKIWILAALLTTSLFSWANPDADDRSSEAGSNDAVKCEGQCVSPNFNQSLSRVSPKRVIEIANMLFNEGKTPKIYEESKALKEKGQ